MSDWKMFGTIVAFFLAFGIAVRFYGNYKAGRPVIS